MLKSKAVKSEIFAYLAFTMLGFCFGWLGSVYFSGDAGIQEAVALYQPPVSHVTNAEYETSPETESEVNFEASEPKLEMPLKRDDTLELLPSGSLDQTLSASQIIDYLTHRLGDRHSSIFRETILLKLLRDKPELSFALIDQFATIDHARTQQQLGVVLMHNNALKQHFLEPRLMEKIKLNQDRSEMLELLKDGGLQSNSSINYLVEEIPYMDNPKDAASAISAIAQSSWANNSLVLPAARERISNLMSEYLQSEYPEVRAASIAAISSFPSVDYENQVLEGFDDDSSLVRSQAMNLYFNKPFDSPELVSSLVLRVQNQNTSYAERSSLVRGLLRLNISEEDMQVVKNAKNEIRQYFKSLNKQQLEAIYRKQQNQRP